MNKEFLIDLFQRFTSRKFLVVIAAVLILFFRNQLGLTPDDINTIKQILLMYLAAEGTADAVARYKSISPVSKDEAQE